MSLKNYNDTSWDRTITKHVLERTFQLAGEYCLGIRRGLVKKITRNFSQEESVLFSKFKTDISLIKIRRDAEHRY